MLRLLNSDIQRASCSPETCPINIGLMRSSAGQFSSWLDGAPFGGTAYANWKIREPNNAGGENCVELLPDTGKWNDIMCSSGRFAIREKPQPATWCENGWSPFGQCCYRVLTTLQPFDAHRSDCATLGGQLVSISNAAENIFVNRQRFSKRLAAYRFLIRGDRKRVPL